MAAVTNLFQGFKVQSDRVEYLHDEIRATYDYQGLPRATLQGDTLVLEPETVRYEFRTRLQVPRLGLLIVGLGGNNGSTLTAAILANRLNLKWRKRSKEIHANYYGSVTQASTVRIGTLDGKDIYVPMSKILPMVNPNDLVISGWDISGANLAEAMERADVFDADLQRQLREHLKSIVPMKAYFDPAFVAGNQTTRADNVLQGTKKEALAQLRQDIRYN